MVEGPLAVARGFEEPPGRARLAEAECLRGVDGLGCDEAVVLAGDRVGWLGM